ncbi:GroES-like protein, partial [Aspergillus ellipticus CBS 707.79]
MDPKTPTASALAALANPSCLLYGPLDARYEDRPIPTIDDPHDVIVKIAYTGVCGSDVHFHNHAGIRTFITPSHPLTLGHESSGTIHATGPAVHTLSPGDPVALEPGIPCRRCPSCKAGTYNLCPRMRFAADPPHTHGTLTRYYKLPEDFCYRLPDGVGLREGVLMEPLGVAVHAVRLAGVRPGMRVVVFGAGAVG